MVRLRAPAIVAALCVVAVAAEAKPARKKKKRPSAPIALNEGKRRVPNAAEVGAPVAAVSGAELVPAATSTAVQTKPQPPPWPPLNWYSLLPREDLIAELETRHLAGGSFGDLIERVTRGLVAAPYLLSPLGEGAMPDPDPRFRLDAFDCTTFVETAIAMVRCDQLEAIAAELDRIRYAGGEIAFHKRHHLMASDWIPSLVAAGYAEDITARVGGKETRAVKLELDEKRWKKRRIARSLVLDEVPTGTFTLAYVPVEKVISVARDIPPGTIINVVRADVAYSPEVITHQGIVITRPGEKTRFVRHASPISKRVIDETLDHMIARYLKKENRAWPVIGVNLLAIVDPTPRR